MASGTIRRGLLASLAAMTFPSAPALAQDDDGLSPEMQQSVDWAAQRGWLMFLYDQAAWHGTDAFVADIGRTGFDTSWMRGYIVLHDSDNRLRTVFFGERNGQLVEAASYLVEGSEVVGGGLLEDTKIVPLTPDAVRMAEVRQDALNKMRELEYGLCVNAQPNTIVLPPADDGEITVYILTPSTDNGSYPLGGHYRLTFDREGNLASHRRFLNSCLDLSYGTQDEGSSPVAAFGTHLLDDHPVEIHFFASRNIPPMLLIGTVENRLMWIIDHGLLQGVETIPED